MTTIAPVFPGTIGDHLDQAPQCGAYAGRHERQRRDKRGAAAWAAVKNATGKAWRGLRIGLKAARILAVSKSLPLPLRILLVVGCIQIPVLPVDEIALGVALGWLFLRHRGTLRDALDTARNEIKNSSDEKGHQS